VFIKVDKSYNIYMNFIVIFCYGKICGMWNLLEKWLFGIDQEEDMANFIKKYPMIDIRQIIEKVEIFNQIVQSRNLEIFKQCTLVLDEDLKKNINRGVVLAYFLCKYSFHSIFPLNKKIKFLQDDTVKIYMEYRKVKFASNSFGVQYSYFSYYLIFKQIGEDWIIVKTNLYNKLQWREWIILFLWLLAPLLLWYVSLIE